VFYVPATQYRLYGRRFLQVKRPNQQYQKYWRRKLQRKTTQQTERKQKLHICIHTVYNNMRWLGDSSRRGQGCQAWTAVGLLPQYPQRQIKYRHYHRGPSPLNWSIRHLLHITRSYASKWLRNIIITSTSLQQSTLMCDDNICWSIQWLHESVTLRSLKLKIESNWNRDFSCTIKWFARCSTG